LATDDDLKLMAEKGTYLDPQAGLVIEELSLHKDKYRDAGLYGRRFCGDGESPFA
jgi:hypothetical protein